MEWDGVEILWPTPAVLGTGGFFFALRGVCSTEGGKIPNPSSSLHVLS